MLSSNGMRSLSGGARARRALSDERLRLLHRLLDGSHQVEGLLRQLVVLAFQDLPEAADRVPEPHVHAGRARELLRHVERLREEALELAGARDGELVLLT